MKILELFAGTKSIGKAFEEKGHEVFSIDWDKRLKGISWYIDILKIDSQDIIQGFGKPDIVWASPDCTSYSVAAIYHHRIREKNGNLTPKTEYAKICDETNVHVLRLIEELEPKYWFIENPRGGLRKMDFMKKFPMYTVTYCQYGDMRMKPTDIWTNHPKPDFKPPCKNGMSCHTSAPRGAKTGTQSLKLSERGKIPKELCEHVVKISSH